MVVQVIGASYLKLYLYCVSCSPSSFSHHPLSQVSRADRKWLSLFLTIFIASWRSANPLPWIIWNYKCVPIIHALLCWNYLEEEWMLQHGMCLLDYERESPNSEHVCMLECDSCVIVDFGEALGPEGGSFLQNLEEWKYLAGTWQRWMGVKFRESVGCAEAGGYAELKPDLSVLPLVLISWIELLFKWEEVGTSEDDNMWTGITQLASDFYIKRQQGNTEQVHRMGCLWGKGKIVYSVILSQFQWRSS